MSSKAKASNLLDSTLSGLELKKVLRFRARPLGFAVLVAGVLAGAAASASVGEPSNQSFPSSASPGAGSSDSPSTLPAEVTVQTGDSLASILPRLGLTDVSIEQAVVSIYRENPGAFFGSVHQLRAGSTLRIPERATMRALPESEARRELQSQAGVFEAYRERVVAAEQALESAAGEAATSSNGAASAGEQGRRAATGGPASQGLAVGSEALREQQQRLALIEESVAELQRQLEQRDRQLASLREQVESGRQAPGAVDLPDESVAAPSPDTDVRQASQDPAVSAPFLSLEPSALPAAPVPSAVAPDGGRSATTQEVGSSATPDAGSSATPDAGPSATAADTNSSAALEDAGSSANTEDEDSSTTAGAPPASVSRATESTQTPLAAGSSSPDAEAHAAAGATTAEPTPADDSFGSRWLVPALAALALASAVYGWYVMRRRREGRGATTAATGSVRNDSASAARASGGSPDPVRKPEPGKGAASIAVAGGGAGASAAQARDRQSQEPLVLAGAELAQADPLAQAKVYLAYGRGAEAEEILREALRRQPERQDIRFQLLKLHAGRRDLAGYGLLARQMHELSGGRNEEWPEVALMGLTLEPDNPLYDLSDDEPLPSDETGTGFDASLGEALAQRDESENRQPLSERDPAANRDVAANRDPLANRDAAADRGQASTGQDGPSDLERAIGGRFELPSLDFGDPEPDEPRPAIEAPRRRPDDFRLDLPSLEELERGDPRARSAEGQGQDLPDLLDDDKLEISSREFPRGDGAGVRWQEMDTKLDLAEAYQEIGDEAGARELLAEVARDGDSGQRRRARALLAGL